MILPASSPQMEVEKSYSRTFSVFPVLDASLANWHSPANLKDDDTVSLGVEGLAMTVRLLAFFTHPAFKNPSSEIDSSSEDQTCC